jgi:tetratricopeptide (TPR) repeat protein
MSDSLITLHTGTDALFCQTLVDALRAARIACVHLEEEGRHVVRVSPGDVAAAAAILAEYLPQGGVRASGPRSAPVDAAPAPAPLGPPPAITPQPMPGASAVAPLPAFTPQPPGESAAGTAHLASALTPQPSPGASVVEPEPLAPTPALTSQPPPSPSAIATTSPVPTAPASRQAAGSIGPLVALLIVFPVSLAGFAVKVPEGNQWGSLIFWSVVALGAALGARKPGGNALAAWAAVASVAMLGSAVFAPLLRDASPAMGPVTLVVIGLIVFGVASLSVAALVVGSVTGSSAGRGYAVSSLFVAGLFAFGFVSGLLKGRGEPSADESRPQPLLVNEEALNFRFRPPGTPWHVASQPKSLNKDASLVVVNSRDDLYFVVIAEEAGGLGLEADEILEAWLTGRESMMVGARPSIAPRTVAGIEGRTVRAVLKPTTTKQMMMRNTAITSRGFLYQLMCWGELGKERLIETSCDQLLGRFELIDKVREARGRAVAPPPFQTADLAFRVELESGWAPMSVEAKTQRYPNAVYAATCGDEAGFAVNLIPLKGRRYPGPALEQAALALYSLSSEGLERHARKLGDVEATELVYHAYDPRSIVHHRFVVAPITDAVVVALDYRVDATKCPESLSRVTLTASPQPTETTASTFAATFHRHVGDALAAGKQVSPAIEAYLTALALDPQHYDSAWGLVNVGTKLDATAEVTRAFEAMLARRGAGDEMRAVWASFLADTGKEKKAAEVYEKLFAAGCSNDDVFADWVHLLEQLKQRPKAWKVLRAYQQAHDTSRIAALEAGLLFRQGEADKAVKLLEQRLAAGYHEGLAVQLMTVLSGLERHEAVLEWAATARQARSPDAEVFRLQAGSELALRRYAAARRTCEAGLRAAPGDEVLERLQRIALDELGQGNNRAIREPLEAVPLPPGVPMVPPPPTGAEAETEYLFAGTAIHFTPEVRYAETRYLRLKVADAEAVEAFSTLTFRFDPRYEQIFLNSLTVSDAAGKELAKGKADDCYLADAADEERGTSRRTLFVPVPALAPGATVELSLTTQWLTPPAHVPFRELTLARGRPTRLSVVAVTAPRARTTLEASPGLERTSQGETTLFVARHLTALVEEPFSIPYDRRAPMVWLGDSARTWDSELAAYRKDLGPLLSPDATLTALARKLTADVPAERRVAVLSRYVGDNVVYKAIEFGRGAQVPRPPREVLGRKYGDCKDQSLLLWHLLAGAGIAADLALVRTSGSLQRAVPSLDQFDHVIVSVPGAPFRFVDPTRRWANPEEGPAPFEAGEVLLVQAAPARFVELGTPRLVGPDVEVERELRLSGDELEVNEDVALRGWHAESLRSQLSGATGKQRTERVLGWLDEGSSLTSVTAENVEEPTRPLKVKLTYRKRSAVRRLGDQVLVTPPTSWERQRISVPRLEHRTSPFAVRLPVDVRSRTWLRASGEQVVAQDAAEAKGRALQWGLSIEPHDGGKARVFSFARQPTAGDVAEYDRWWQEHERALTALGQPFVVTPGPSRAAPARSP